MPQKQRWYYSVDASTVLEITDRVRLPSPGGDGQPATVGAHAEEGSGESVNIEVDDPNGDLIMLLHRRVYSTSDAAAVGSQVIGNWFIQNLDVVRMDPWTGTARRWLVQMVDENSLLERRIFVGASSDRPAETDIARILWALTETELNVLSPDVTYIDQTNPKDLDAANYDQQKPKAILEHCKTASGKNYWIKYEEAAAVGGDIVSSSVAAASVITTTTAHGLVTGQQVAIAGHSGSTPDINGTHTVTVTGTTTFTIPVNVTVGGTGGTTSTVGRYVLCYFNAATSVLYPSTIALSNVASEIDSSTVFAISDDTKLNRSGDRAPVSGMVRTYTGGYVYEQDTTVGDTYVYRDVSASSINVKTAAAATAIAVRELAELATPDDEVEVEFYPDWDQVNDAMHGMSIMLRATHLPPFTSDNAFPSYSTGQQMRIMRRQVRVRENGGQPAVRLWMTPMNTPFICATSLEPGTAEGFYGPLGGLPAYGDPNPDNPNVHYWNSGTSAPAVPTASHALDNWGFPVFNVVDAGAPTGLTDTCWDGAANYVRCLVIGPGTMTIYLREGPEAGTRHYTALLQYKDGVAQPTIETKTGFATNGTTLVFEIPASYLDTYNVEFCSFWVNIEFDGSPAKRDISFGGFGWVPA